MAPLAAAAMPRIVVPDKKQTPPSASSAVLCSLQVAAGHQLAAAGVSAGLAAVYWQHFSVEKVIGWRSFSAPLTGQKQTNLDPS